MTISDPNIPLGSLLSYSFQQQENDFYNINQNYLIMSRCFSSRSEGFLVASVILPCELHLQRHRSVLYGLHLEQHYVELCYWRKILHKPLTVENRPILSLQCTQNHRYFHQHRRAWKYRYASKGRKIDINSNLVLHHLKNTALLERFTLW